MTSLCASWSFLLCTVMLSLSIPGWASSGETPASSVIEFGRVVYHQSPHQEVSIKNSGPVELAIDSVDLTPPLKAISVTPTIAPGDSGVVTLGLADQRPSGPFIGAIQVNFAGEVFDPIAFRVTGEFVPAIEFRPRPFFALASQRGVQKSAVLEIFNHRPEPLEIDEIIVPHGEGYSVDLATVVPNVHYSLTMTLDPDAEVGRNRSVIRLLTTQGEEIKLGANTLIRERVYTFPQRIDMGAIPLSVTRLQPAQLEQTLMVYRLGTDDFQLSASTDVQGLLLKTERGPSGDRFEITLSFSSEWHHPADITGSVFLHTNDTEFPELQVPVSGRILHR